jgi:hypothetical protein
VEFSDPSDDWERIVSNEARLAKAPWWKGAETMPGLGTIPRRVLVERVAGCTEDMSPLRENNFTVRCLRVSHQAGLVTKFQSPIKPMQDRQWTQTRCSSSSS